MEDKGKSESQLLAELERLRQRVAELEASDAEHKRTKEGIQQLMQLRGAHGELESRVQQRTAELAAVNEALEREIGRRERAQQVLRDSEALYASLVENLPVHVLRKDLEGRFVFANRSFCELLDRPLAEILGRTDFDLFPEALARKFREDDRTVMETGELLETVEENRSRGDSRYMEVMKSAVRDAAGQIVGVQIVFWDVTDRKKAEAALEQERYLLHALMDTLPHNIYFKDTASRFLRINKALATCFRLRDAAEALGKTDFDFFTEEHARQAMADEREILRTGQPVVDKEEKETWSNGHATWALTTKLPLYDDQRRVIGTFGISRDITERKREAQALQLAKEAAESANRAKSAFLANMSHEIRTPLNAVIGMTELVLKSPLTDQQREFLQTVRDSGEALLAVINDILDFSKIEAGKLELDSRAFDLWENLGETLKPFAIRAQQQGLELASFIHPQVPRMVLGDYNRLRQVVINLLGNALKFTESGEVSLEVMRESQAGNDVLLHFIVADTGIGIPAAKQSTIFEMFEQADTSTTRRHGGTGLGLAIAARIIGLMDGRIWVDSEVGRGSRFHFTVRLGLAAGGPAVPPPLPAVAPPAVPRRRAANLYVLLAEDSSVNQKLVTALLEEQGHKIRLVNNGREALAAWESEAFDLILMDVQMPEMDGLEAAARIRARERHSGAHVPIAAMTAYALKGDRERCLEAGMDAYIAKPIRADEFFDTIEALVGASVEAAPPADTAPLPDALPPGAEWPEAMRAVRGNQRLLRTIVETAAREIPRLLAAIRAAVAAGNAAELQLAAHTLKGTIRYFASGQGFEQVRRLETMGRDKCLQGAAEALAVLEADARLLAPAFAAYLQRRE
jgi:PAS domain S-box-containing protein